MKILHIYSPSIPIVNNCTPPRKSIKVIIDAHPSTTVSFTKYSPIIKIIITKDIKLIKNPKAEIILSGTYE